MRNSSRIQPSGERPDRSAAVLRILKDRSTVAEEAARMDVDADTVRRWLRIALESVGRAMKWETS